MAKSFTPRKTTEERVNNKIEEITADLHESKQETTAIEKVGFSIKLPRHIYEKLSSEKQRTGMSRASIILKALDLYWREG
ncbi:MAG: hypothetical protein AAFY48_01270 [Bacteroidota bacterium]